MGSARDRFVAEFCGGLGRHWTERFDEGLKSVISESRAEALEEAAKRLEGSPFNPDVWQRKDFVVTMLREWAKEQGK